MIKDNIVLKFIEIVKIKENVRSTKDLRRKVNRYICSYQGTDENEYRKAFEFPSGTNANDINIPLQIS